MAKKFKGPKLPFGIDEAFVSEVAGLDAAGKKSLMVRIEGYKQEAKEWLATDETVKSLKENLKEIEGPSRDTVKAANNKLKYIVDELKRLNQFE